MGIFSSNYQDYTKGNKGRNTSGDAKAAKKAKAEAAKAKNKSRGGGGLRSASSSDTRCQGVRAGRRCTKRINPAKQTHCSSCLRHGAGWADD